MSERGYRGCVYTEIEELPMSDFVLPKLDFELDALAPVMSKETLEYHYGKHHQTYINALNALIRGTVFDGRSLKEIIKTSQGVMFDNAAQTFNHAFFWKSICPNGGGEPSGRLMELICQRWGSFEGFKKAFQQAAIGRFGSGWVWLVHKSNGSLEIIATMNAETPLTEHMRPLLVLDVWEHAYYIDYRNARAKYVEAFFDKIVNWKYAEDRLNGCPSGCDCK